VTESLVVALRQIQKDIGLGQALVLWVDALYINQSDKSKESLQVQLMGKIFSKTCQVVLWLGEKEDDSDLTMDLICAMGTSLISTKDVSSCAGHPEIL
jgi:hypothetical protein